VGVRIRRWATVAAVVAAVTSAALSAGPQSAIAAPRHQGSRTVIEPVRHVSASRRTQISVELGWTNPSFAGFRGVMVRMRQGGTAPSRTGGTLVADVSARRDSRVVRGLSAATMYSFALFARGTRGRYSQRITKTVTTLTPPTTLSAGQTLKPGRALRSADGRYEAVMQADGNFVEYQVGNPTALWSAQTSTPGSSITMQTDGNLVVYAPGQIAVWSSSTAPSSDDTLTMQTDSNLVLYSRGGVALWSSFGGRTSNYGDRLGNGQTLVVGQALWSDSGQYEAVMQGDGNFVVYNNGAAIWDTQTGNAGSTITMQTDGNLVIYAPGGGAVWNSGTAPSSGDTLAMQDDGNLVIYQAGNVALWSAEGGRISQTGSPTAADQAAAAWAKNQTGKTQWEYLCLTFVYQAWENAGVSAGTMSARAGYTTTNNTYPVDEWDYWASGHPPQGQWHSGHDAAPPVGAIIYFSNKLGRTDSHTTISLGGGLQISPDTTGVSGPESVNTNNYRTMLGWWLPE
jgi:hypothetical protein